MTKEQDQQVWLLQDNLSSLRKIAGWTADDLGIRIGVSKQTISNLENKKNPMTLTQYIAIRAVMDYKIKLAPRRPENKILQQALLTLLDSENKTADYKKKKDAVTGLSGIVASGMAAGMLLPMASNLFLGLGLPIVITAAAAGAVGAASTGAKKVDWMKVIQPVQKK